MTVIKTMILVGLFGLAMHFGYYWAAAAIVAVFVLGVYLAKRSGSRKALIVAHPSSKTDGD